MKKYRVNTTHLNFKYIQRGDILFKHEKFWSTSGAPLTPGAIMSKFTDDQFNLLLEIHPEWFEEVTDSPKEFTKEDMKRAFDAGEIRGDYLAAENSPRMLGRMIKFEHWFNNEYKRPKQKIEEQKFSKSDLVQCAVDMRILISKTIVHLDEIPDRVNEWIKQNKK